MLPLKVLLASCVTLMKDMAIYCERTSTSFRDFEVYSKSNSEWRTILKEFQVIRSLYHLYQSNLSIRRARHSMLWKRGKRKTRDVWEEWLIVFCRNPPLQERKLEPKTIVIILEAAEAEKKTNFHSCATGRLRWHLCLLFKSFRTKRFPPFVTVSYPNSWYFNQHNYCHFASRCDDDRRYGMNNITEESPL